MLTNRAQVMLLCLCRSLAAFTEHSIYAQTGGLMLSLYRYFLTAQLAATSLARNYVDIFYLRAQTYPDARTNCAAGVGAHAAES